MAPVYKLKIEGINEGDFRVRASPPGSLSALLHIEKEHLAPTHHIDSMKFQDS